MHMAHIIRRDIGYLATMLMVGFVVGAIYVTIGSSSISLMMLLRGGIYGLLVALSCAIIDVVISPHFTHLSFAAMLLLGTVVYALVGVLVVVLCIVVTNPDADLLANPARLLGTIPITLLTSYLANVLMAMRRVLGAHVLGWLLIGRYRRPVEESRMFMFLDLASSTAVAEQIGHVKYHRLIHKFWCDISEAIVECRGDIYKYVGDEVIITWLLASPKLDNCWLECFFKIRDTIRAKEDEYRRLFGVVPQFRASLHCGIVVAGEMGDWKREVGFIGDTVNTAARILDACKANGKDFIISEPVRQRIADTERYLIEELPEARLRGKQGQVTLFAVESVSE